MDLDLIIKTCRKDTRRIGGIERLALCDEVERLQQRVTELIGHLDWLGWGSDECESQRAKDKAELEQLRKLCKASYHLLMGSNAIYDPRGDTGPTHWLETRDKLLNLLLLAFPTLKEK
jgi:hypothetical protein